MPLQYSLLIVEDDLDTLDALSRWFIRTGFDVTPVFHPRQALSAATIKPFHVALIDYTLPEMDGLCLCQRLQRIVRDLRVILLASHADPVLHGAAVDARVFSCVLKPFRLTDVERAVESALEHQATTAAQATTFMAETARA